MAAIVFPTTHTLEAAARMGARAAVLFDIDGTLVDNSYFHTLAWFRACREHGEDIAMARLHRLIGMGSDMLTTELFGRSRPELAEAHGRQIAPLFAEMRAVGGAGPLLRRARGAGLGVVVASSAKGHDLERLLDIAGVGNLVDAAVTSSDVERTKPAPDIFAVAMERCGLEAADCVAVGDTGWDVEAALQLGVPTVGLLTGGWSRGELVDAGAAAVYRDAAELLDGFEASPLGALGRPSRGRGSTDR